MGEELARRTLARGNIVRTRSYLEWKRIVQEKIREGYAILYARYYHDAQQGIVIYEKME